MTGNENAAQVGGQGRRRMQSDGANREVQYTTPRRDRLVILSRLDGLREIRPDTWRARCPAHESKGLTLSLKDVGESLLVHCHAGCSAAEVLAAVGLELADLYDGPLNVGPVARKDRIRINYGDLVRAIRFDIILLMIVHGEHANRFDDTEIAVVSEITGRILRAMEAVR